MWQILVVASGKWQVAKAIVASWWQQVASGSQSQRRYSRGAADILEILNAQTALADAKDERIHALADWRSARLSLLASAGQLGLSHVRP